jgi:hypothetical protein
MKAQINQNEWTIYEVERGHNMLVINGEICRGTAHYRQQEIYLDNAFTKGRIFQVLCHELAHAYLYETQLESIENINEEMLCEFVGLYGKTIVDTALTYMEWRKTNKQES